MKYLRLLYDPDDDKYLWSIFFLSLARDHIIKVLRSTGKVPKGCSAGMNQNDYFLHFPLKVNLPRLPQFNFCNHPVSWQKYAYSAGW